MTNNKAIEILNALAWVQGGPDREETITAISMAIEALNQTAWIPVGERLPDENGLYLVTSDKWGEWEVFAEIFYDGEWVKAEPIAWMPLPELYKGGDLK